MRVCACVHARAGCGFGETERKGETVTSGFTCVVTPSDAVMMNSYNCSCEVWSSKLHKHGGIIHQGYKTAKLQVKKNAEESVLIQSAIILLSVCEGKLLCKVPCLTPSVFI